MRAAQWRADPAWRTIDLLSDVHLQADAPRTFEAWRAHLLGTSADAVLILGDLFEVWIGDDAAHSGFGRDCAEVLRLAAQRRVLGFMHGNRDFLLGPAMHESCGMLSLADPTLASAWGQRLLLTHGDALCTGDVAYQRYRAEVRSANWRQAFIALPLDERQRRARAMRDASAAHQASMGEGDWFDVDPQLALQWMAQAGADTLVHGHTHRPGCHDLGDGRVRHVLGDWDFDHPPPRARILRWTPGGLMPHELGQA